MAECANSPSSLELPVWKGCGRVGRSNVPRSCHLSTPHSRKNFRRSSKFELIFTPKWAPARTLKPIVSPLRKDGSWSCSCLAALADPDGATLSDWVSVSNQLLLLTSIFLTYMAGVIPVQKSHSSSQKTVLEENSVRKNLKSPGGTRNSNDQVNLNQAWNDVKAKLLDSLDAVEHNSYLVEDFLKSEKQHPNRPLSLDAVSGGSKLRLLWASFYHLEEEVNDILGDNNAVTLNGWMTMFPKVINNSCHAVCTAWLKEELQLESNKSDKVLASLMIEKLKRDDAALRNIRKYGKEDLYAELLYFLKFGSSRNARLYDHSLFVTHGDSILEDLVINIADGIANLYLELISVDGSLPDGMNDLGTAMCSLSTRALQRLRNEVIEKVSKLLHHICCPTSIIALLSWSKKKIVSYYCVKRKVESVVGLSNVENMIALNQWLYQNMETVASIYEDRFDLCVLQLKAIEEPTHTQEGDHTSWWKRLSLTKSSAVSSSFECIVICQFRMPAKRTKELRALTGWRYYYSLYLELYDIGLPLVRAVIDKISSAISFFLVTLIGRSLGLIYSGIRQSLRWK